MEKGGASMTIHETAWIAPGAHVSGDVTIGPGCGV